MCYLELLSPAAAPARETAEFSMPPLHLETHLEPLPLTRVCPRLDCGPQSCEIRRSIRITQEVGFLGGGGFA